MLFAVVAAAVVGGIDRRRRRGQADLRAPSRRRPRRRRAHDGDERRDRRPIAHRPPPHAPRRPPPVVVRGPLASPRPATAPSGRRRRPAPGPAGLGHAAHGEAGVADDRPRPATAVKPTAPSLRQTRPIPDTDPSSGSISHANTSCRSLSFAFVHRAPWLIGAAPPALAQVSDAERAGARELFKEGDQLQRAGHFAEALDKFQRAQQVFAAPTNLLRIAECEAALGRLVESAEAYREVLRTPLPAGSPPAFQAAVDQAKAELSQVEPRVPEADRAGAARGRAEPAAADRRAERVRARSSASRCRSTRAPTRSSSLAPGYASSRAAGRAQGARRRRPWPSPSTPSRASRTPRRVAGGVDRRRPPGLRPRPAVRRRPRPRRSSRSTSAPAAAPVSRVGLLFGLHLGVEVAGRQGARSERERLHRRRATSGRSGWPTGSTAGLRFARHWYIGLTLDHATLSSQRGSPADRASGTPARTRRCSGSSSRSSRNPDRVSFYGELGLGRALVRRARDADMTAARPQAVRRGEFTLGVGVWIPAGRSLPACCRRSPWAWARSSSGDTRAEASANPYSVRHLRDARRRRLLQHRPLSGRPPREAAPVRPQLALGGARVRRRRSRRGSNGRVDMPMQRNTSAYNCLARFRLTR